MGSRSPPILAIPFPSPPVPVTFSWSRSSAALPRVPVHYGPFHFGSPPTRRCMSRHVRRQRITGQSPRVCGGESRTGGCGTGGGVWWGLGSASGVWDGGWCLPGAGDRLPSHGRYHADPRLTVLRAFLPSRHGFPAPSPCAALQRRARAWYSRSGRGSDRGLRRPGGRHRRGGKRCVFVFILCTLLLPSSPFSLLLLCLSHECYSPCPPAPAAHTWLRSRTVVSVVPRLAAHVRSATAPSLPPSPPPVDALPTAYAASLIQCPGMFFGLSLLSPVLPRRLSRPCSNPSGHQYACVCLIGSRLIDTRLTDTRLIGTHLIDTHAVCTIFPTHSTSILT